MATKQHVFISYHHQDNGKYMQELRDYIQKLGFTAWADLDIPGGSTWTAVIDEELAKSTHLVLIWTPNVLRSPNVTYEWCVALISDIRVIPILSPEYEDFRPSEVPELLANLNFIKDPIQLSTEQRRFIQALSGGDQNEAMPGLPTEILKAFRHPEAAKWSTAKSKLDQWATQCSDVKLLKAAAWLLPRLVSPTAPPENRRNAAEAEGSLREQVEIVEARISMESICELRCSLHNLAKTLQGKITGDEIQALVKGYMRAWSLAQYGVEKPPPPKLAPGFEFDISHKRKCGLCLLAIDADKHGCCAECGLFMSFWEHLDEDAAAN